MRPRGEIRAALAGTLARLAPERGALNCLELAAASQVGRLAAMDTLRNMVRAGEVLIVGAAKPAGSRRWHKLYELAPPEADDAPQAWGGIEALAQVMHSLPAGGDVGS